MAAMHASAYETAGQKSKTKLDRSWMSQARRWFQIGFLALFCAMPFVGVIQFDIPHWRVVLFGQQIWLNDILFIYLVWGMMVPLLVGVYMLLGRVFCGWMCPQTTFTEVIDKFLIWANGSNKLFHSVARRRFVIFIYSVTVAWLFAFVVISYFVTPEVLWFHTKTFWAWLWGLNGPKDRHVMNYEVYQAVRDSLRFQWVLWIALTIDLSWARHRWCRMFCPYGIWQSIFRNRHALRVRFDEEHSSACIDCGLCERQCFMGVDPRKQPELTFNCINCGDCIVTCDRVFKKRSDPGLLSFVVGEKVEGKTRLPKVVYLPPLVFLGVGVLFVYSMMNYQPVFASINRVTESELANQGHVQESVYSSFAIEVVNKGRSDDDFALSTLGIPQPAVHFSQDRVHLVAGERTRIYLDIDPDKVNLPQTNVQFAVRVQSENDPGIYALDRASFFKEGVLEGQGVGVSPQRHQPQLEDAPQDEEDP